MKFFTLIFLIIFNNISYAQSDNLAVRIKDLVEVRGVRSNQLTGLGIVVGLQGTGDSKASIATNKAASTVISRLGVAVSPFEVTTKNVKYHFKPTKQTAPIEPTKATIKTRVTPIFSDAFPIWLTFVEAIPSKIDRNAGFTNTTQCGCKSRCTNSPGFNSLRG